MKDLDKLRAQINNVARVEFAEQRYSLASLLYLICGKSKTAHEIWRTSSDSQALKITNLLSLDFTIEENISKCLKNGFAAISKKKFGRISVLDVNRIGNIILYNYKAYS